MEVITSFVDKVKGFPKSTQDFISNGIINRHQSSSRYNQIEILKRLLREAFSDLMKLRDRQDKVERMLPFYKSSKGSPFEEANTVAWGVIDVLGALLLMDDVDEHKYALLDRAGIRTGINSRFTFETGIRQKDTFVAEFFASQKGPRNFDDVFGNSLSLAKVLYVANVSDWFSAVAIPVGAQCRDVGTAISHSHQRENSLTDFLSFGPPLLTQHIGRGIGLTVSKSNVVASLAQFLSRLSRPGSVGHGFSTFGQVVCHLSRGTKLSLLGLHQASKTMTDTIALGPLTMPLGSLKRRNASSAVAESEENSWGGSLAVVLESQLDECTRIGGWVQMEKSNPRTLQWALTMSDTPEDEVGWGLSLGGMNKGPTSWDHFQVEAFMKINVGRNFSLLPGFVYVMDAVTQIPALMVRSTWSP